MKTSSCKAKGRRFQQWVAEKIGDLLKLPWGYDEMIAPREMGQAGTDIRLVGEAKTRFPYSCEIKNQETFSIPSWIEQAKSNQLDGTNWLLFVKKNRFEPIVIMEAEVFFSILKQLEERNSNEIPKKG